MIGSEKIIIKKWIFFITIVVFIFSISCGTSRNKKRKRRYKYKGVYHKVKKGQTLWRIAKVYNVDLKKLSRINNIKDVEKVREGQLVFIPGAKNVKYVKIIKPKLKNKPKFKIKPKLKSKLRRKRLALIWPVNGKFTSSFGIRNSRKHDGIDIAAPSGTYIYASAAGKVIFSGWGPKGYGKVVIIKHTDEFITVYAHNKLNMVKKGQYVKKEDKIAKVGNTGRSTGSHLHFEVRKKRVPVNPVHYLP